MSTMSNLIYPATDVGVETTRQKTALLFRNSTMAFMVNLVNALLLAFVNFSQHVSAGVALSWAACVIAIAAGRYLLSRQFLELQQSDIAVVTWQHRYLGATLVLGIAWGAGSALFMWDAPTGARLFSGLVLGGMVAGAVPVLAPVPAAFRLFALPILIPVAAVILIQANSPLDWAFGAMTVIFLAGVLVSARFLHETLDMSIRLGLEKSHLVETIERARDDAEAALAERRQVEAALGESEERYRLILQHSPTGILQYSNDLIITYCNNRLAQILRAPREKLIGLDMKLLNDQRIAPALNAAIKGDEGYYEGEYISTLTGIRIWVSMTCSPLRDADNRRQGGIAIVEDITDRKRSEQEIRSLAYFDPLTHLPNRRLLMDRLGHALIASNRTRDYGALMILDLDHFKSLNDTQGHDIGDRLLVEVAKRLDDCLSQADTVARLGGDEYVVMLEGLGQAERPAAGQAEMVAEKIRADLNRPYILGGSEAEYFSTTSIGLTLFCGQDDSSEILLKQADVALYQAKDAGRNAIRFFSPAMQSAIEFRTALEADMRRGLDRQEFRLYYQPQVDQAGRLIGAEALIRWHSPSRGLVSPTQFIPLAEETGLILVLGQWVLDTACAQLRQWQLDPRTRDLQLSVNVSARQFHQLDFVEQVHRSLVASGAEPGGLKLELTETVLLDNVAMVISRMQQLDSMGVGFSLDDFGTGYSSLSYLKRLPLDQIKIDQSFIRDVTQDPNDDAIVRAILAMSRSLGLQVIAEGVETKEQRDFLFENGCMAYQGYFFGKPMPIEEWDGFLERNLASQSHNREHAGVKSAPLV